jgi:hypothetical protein
VWFPLLTKWHTVRCSSKAVDALLGCFDFSRRPIWTVLLGTIISPWLWFRICWWYFVCVFVLVRWVGLVDWERIYVCEVEIVLLCAPYCAGLFDVGVSFIMFCVRCVYDFANTFFVVFSVCACLFVWIYLCVCMRVSYSRSAWECLFIGWFERYCLLLIYFHFACMDLERVWCWFILVEDCLYVYEGLLMYVRGLNCFEFGIFIHQCEWIA